MIRLCDLIEVYLGQLLVYISSSVLEQVVPYDSCAIPPIEMIRGAMATEAIISPASLTVLFVDSSLTIMVAPTIRMMQNTQRKPQPNRPCLPCLKRQ